MTKHKTEDYKISAVKYYLNNDKIMANNMKVETLNPNSLVAMLYMKLLKTPPNKHNDIITMFNNNIKKHLKDVN